MSRLNFMIFFRFRNDYYDVSYSLFSSYNL